MPFHVYDCLHIVRIKLFLSQDLQNIADNSRDGLILFSLDTNLQSEHLGEEGILALLEVFDMFPNYTFLWQMDLEKYNEAIPENVHVRKTVPQNDILGNFEFGTLMMA